MCTCNTATQVCKNQKQQAKEHTYTLLHSHVMHTLKFSVGILHVAFFHYMCNTCEPLKLLLVCIILLYSFYSVTTMEYRSPISKATYSFLAVYSNYTCIKHSLVTTYVANGFSATYIHIFKMHVLCASYINFIYNTWANIIM